MLSSVVSWVGRNFRFELFEVFLFLRFVGFYFFESFTSCVFDFLGSVWDVSCVLGRSGAVQRRACWTIFWASFSAFCQSYQSTNIPGEEVVFLLSLMQTRHRQNPLLGKIERTMSFDVVGYQFSGITWEFEDDDPSSRPEKLHSSNSMISRHLTRTARIVAYKPIIRQQCRISRFSTSPLFRAEQATPEPQTPDPRDQQLTELQVRNP